MRLTLVRALLLTISLLFLHSSSASDGWDDEEVGTLIKITGEVYIKEAGKKNWEKIPKELLIDSPLSAGITVRTGLDSNASILLRDETLIKLDQVSEYTIEAIAPRAGWIEPESSSKTSSSDQQTDGIAGGLSGLTTLSKGGLWMLNKNREVALKFKTPTAVVGIRGTELEIRLVGEEQLRVSALEGVADISNEQGRLQLQPNEEANVVAGQAPTKRTLLNPADSVQWTLVVPQLVSDASFQNQPLPDSVKSQLQQIWSQLNSGRVKEAWSTLQQLNHSYPSAALVATLHGLTALMLDQKELAIESAKRATTIAPTFTDGWVVLAQVYQSKFDLKAAERAARKALEITPDHTAAAIILARLRFGTGYVEEAQSIIAAAIEKAPESGEAQNLLGFIEFSLREHQKAENAFQKAIELENSAAPHMGLGILRMRAGNEKEALREMSVAVLLDPRRAMYRTYWAKMLYQMQRYQKALDVLDISKNIDPNDPTPHLYRALILRDLNRPVEAIEALHHSMALNDNRAVFRSRFLLDSDSAVKNVDLSLLYNQLGLSKWASSKAAKAIALDYSNPSAHLFSAGALSAQADRSWGRNSEYLIARLLMPANLNAFNTFNEYTSFLEKPSVDTTLSLQVGSHDQLNQSLLVTGANPKINIAYQIQALTQSNDGWRETNGSELDDLTGYLKWDINLKESLMVVASTQEQKLKDKFSPRYEYDDPSEPEDHFDAEVDRFELGYHRKLEPGSDLLIHYADLDNQSTTDNWNNLTSWLCGELAKDANVANDCINGDFYYPTKHSLLDSSYQQLQLSYTTQSDDHHWVLGASSYRGDFKLNENYTDQYILRGASGSNSNIRTLFTTANTRNDRTQQTLSVQDFWDPSVETQLQWGIHYDRVENANALKGTHWSFNQLSPRIGVSHQIDPKQTLKAAAFEVLLPFLSDRLAPADLVGIPLYRNGVEGSIIREWDLVWEKEGDHTFTSATLFHAESDYSERQTDQSMREWQSTVKGIELALNTIPADQWGLAAGYQYKDIENEQVTSLDRSEQTLDGTLSWVGPNGLSVSMNETFRTIDFDSTRSNEDIWITDLLMSYELAQKQGKVTLGISNLFNNQFNWVTDTFIFNGRDPERMLMIGWQFNL